MLLTLHSTLRTVFLIFGAFWVLVLVALFIGVAILGRRRERASGPESH